jgi:thiol-disulfide isomerase/thioredoxin
MLERLAIAVLLVGLGLAAYFLLKSWQLRRASQATAGIKRASILFFQGDRCAACAAQWRFLEELRAKLDDQIAIERVDADVDTQRAARYAVFTVPTTLIVDRSGVVRHANYGLADARKLAGQVQSLEAA